MPSTPSTPQRPVARAQAKLVRGLKKSVRRVGGQPLVNWERRRITPELTVVMPVHNVEAYLREALDSALTQSVHNLELLAVDDGSTDSSLAILREYERRDARVRVFAQTNSGQGIARNLAVAHARAEFLTFMDSDDTIPPDSFEHVLRALRASGSDFAVGGVRRFRHRQYMGTSWQRTVHQTDRIGTTIDEFPAAMQDIIACNRVFRTDFWRDRVGGFRGHIAYEDHVPMLAAYVRATKFDILNRVIYNWRIREDNTSTGQQKANIENLLDRIAVKEEAHELLRAEATDFVYDVWVARCLEVDFAPFVAQALEADTAYRNILSATYRTFSERATERAWDLVRVFPKIRGHLAAEGRWDAVEDATRYFLSVQQVPPTRVEDGVLLADLPSDRAFAAGLPAHLLRMAPLEAHFEGVLQRVEWGEREGWLAGWMRHRGLDITESEPELTLTLRSGETEVPLEIKHQVIPAANLWAPLPFAGCANAGFRARVPVTDLAELGNGPWQLFGSITTGGITSSGSFHYRINHSSAEHPEPAVIGAESSSATLVTPLWHPSLGFSLTLKPSGQQPTSARLAQSEATLVVHGVEIGDAWIEIEVSGRAIEAGDGVGLGNERTQLELLAVASGDGERQRLRFSTMVTEFDDESRPAPSASYALSLDGVRAAVATDFVGQLPQRQFGEMFNLKISLGDNALKQRAMRLNLGPPLRPEELGTYNQFRMQADYRTNRKDLNESILLASYLGEFASDSQLAIDRHLARTRPDLERVWGVADSSTMIPEGARRVLLNSAEWYDAAATSRYLSRNIDFGPWLRARPEQAYLQTFHGYPFKSMGIDFWRSKAMPPGQIRHALARVNEEWDLILVPSAECEQYYREQYEYTGAVLTAGYPRTDFLVNADAAAVRKQVLSRLGVPEDRTVVLYAPTYRDTLTTKVFAARRFDDLDLDKLTRALGPEHVILVRGHNNNQRDGGRVNRPGIVDVTDYPDINELTLAADVAVMDYSSLRFDWAITGKPMIFFVPDLEAYFDIRRPLFSFEDSAPGPLLRTTAEVADALSDLSGLADRHAGEVSDFNQRFNQLHDGQATERVLDTLLDPAKPWRNWRKS